MDFDNMFVNNVILDRLFEEIKDFDFDNISKQNREITIKNFGIKWVIIYDYNKYEITNLKTQYSTYLDKDNSVIDFIQCNIL